MTLAGLEPTTQASDRPQTHALGRATTRIGIFHLLTNIEMYNKN
jgi:hypothetical protein